MSKTKTANTKSEWYGLLPPSPVSAELLAMITGDIKQLNSSPPGSSEACFAYGEAIQDLARAFSNMPATTPAEALAHVLISWSELEELEEVANLESYKARALLRRLRLRAFYLAGFIEYGLGVRREDHGLDYFATVSVAYHKLFPHETPAQYAAALKLDEFVKEWRKKKETAAAL